MKVFRVELMVLDHDDIGSSGIFGAIENTKYPNYCISPSVESIDERDIGEWSDDHPLNKRSTASKVFAELFAQPAGAQEAPAGQPMTDAWIEAAFKVYGGQWTGDYWKIEDADFHPFVRSIAASSPAVQEAPPVARMRTWFKEGERHAQLDDWCDGIDELPEGEHVLRAASPRAPAGQEVPEDSAHGQCAAWLRLFIHKNGRDPFPQEVWNAAAPQQAPAAVQGEDHEAVRRYLHWTLTEGTANERVVARTALNLLDGASPPQAAQQAEAAPAQCKVCEGPDDANCVRTVEAWHGERKVTIYPSTVLRSWGTNIETEMSEEPRSHEAVGRALEWLYSVAPAQPSATAGEADLHAVLQALVEGLDKTNWSSWQTTAHFSGALENARAALAQRNGSWE
jgi:hypothetical protein